MIAQYSFTSIIIKDDWLSSSKDENILGMILYKIKCIWLKIDIAYSYDKCREENMSKESTFYNDYSPPPPWIFILSSLCLGQVDGWPWLWPFGRVKFNCAYKLLEIMKIYDKLVTY